MPDIDIDKLQIEIEASSAKAAQQIDKLTSSFKKFKQSVKADKAKDAGEEFAEIEKSAGRAVSKVEKLSRKKDELRKKTELNIDSKSADSASKKISKLRNVLDSLKRIAFYRLIRSAIKAVTDAIREGLENAYEFSKITGGDLAPALDRVATASLQLKNQLGAAFGQILVALEPLLVTLINLVTKLAQGFTWLFAVLSGSDKYLVANEVATSWKEADKAAKGYQRTLLGIDEINRLNSPASGGGSNANYGEMFHYEPTSFKLPDIKNWAKPIIGGINSGLQKVGELASALIKLPSPNVSINLNSENSLSAIKKVSTALNNLLEKSPYIFSVKAKIESPTKNLENITQSVSLMAQQVKNKFLEMRDYSSARLVELKESVESAAEKMRVIAKEKTSKLASEVQKDFDSLKASAQSSFQYTKQNIETFFTETIPLLNKWSANVITMSLQAFSGFAQSAYGGLQNAANNVVTFVNSTAQAIYSWASSSAKNFADWANSVAKNVGSALSSAWQNFKNFMSATGQALSGWWTQNKTWVVPLGIAAAVTVGSIALAPATGGLSLAAAGAFAKGGFPEDGVFFANRNELVGQFSNGRTAVANNEQITDGIADAVYNAFMSAFSATGNNDNRPIEIYLDGKQIATSTTKYQRQYARATGV